MEPSAEALATALPETPPKATEATTVVESSPPRQRVMVGPQGECIEKLHRWNENGAKALFLNPTRDGIRQAYQFMNNVASTLPQPAAV